MQKTMSATIHKSGTVGNRTCSYANLLRRILFASVAALMIFATSAVASDTENVDVSIEIPTIFVLGWSVPGTSIDLTGANAVTAAEFTAGYKDGISGGTLSLTANDVFDLTVKAVSDTFLGGSGTKPVSEMMVRIGGGSYIPLSGTSEVTLINGNPPTSGDNRDLAYRIDLLADDTPGVYQTTLIYTIKAHI